MIRTLLCFITLLACLTTASSTDLIKFTVPYPPGGGSDISLRLITNELKKRDINSFTTHKPGNMGYIGSLDVAESHSGGKSLLYNGSTNIALVDLQHPSKPLSRQLFFVTEVVKTPLIVITSKKSGIKTFEDLQRVDLSKTTLSFGHGGNTTKIVTLQLLKEIGLREGIIHVDYKGLAPAITDLIGGHIDIIIAPLNAAVRFIDSDRVNMIAYTSKTSLPGLEKIPTVSKYVKGYKHYLYWGISLSINDKQHYNHYLGVLTSVIQSNEFAIELAKSYTYPVSNNEIGNNFMRKNYSRAITMYNEYREDLK